MVPSSPLAVATPEMLFHLLLCMGLSSGGLLSFLRCTAFCVQALAPIRRRITIQKVSVTALARAGSRPGALTTAAADDEAARPARSSSNSGFGFDTAKGAQQGGSGDAGGICGEPSGAGRERDDEGRGTGEVGEDEEAGGGRWGWGWEE